VTGSREGGQPFLRREPFGAPVGARATRQRDCREEDGRGSGRKSGLAQDGRAGGNDAGSSKSALRGRESWDPSVESKRGSAARTELPLDFRVKRGKEAGQGK
jgi:hypothetical protein